MNANWRYKTDIHYEFYCARVLQICLQNASNCTDFSLNFQNLPLRGGGRGACPRNLFFTLVIPGSVCLTEQTATKHGATLWRWKLTSQGDQFVHFRLHKAVPMKDCRAAFLLDGAWQDFLHMWLFCKYSGSRIPASGKDTCQRGSRESRGEWTAKAEKQWKQRTEGRKAKGEMSKKGEPTAQLLRYQGRRWTYLYERVCEPMCMYMFSLLHPQTRLSVLYFCLSRRECAHHQDIHPQPTDRVWRGRDVVFHAEAFQTRPLLWHWRHTDEGLRQSESQGCRPENR